MVLPAHNHAKCLELAGDNKSSQALTPRKNLTSNILMYVRKSEDVDEILDVLQDSILYISKTLNVQKKRRQFIYLERWALDALQNYMSSQDKGISLVEIASNDDMYTLTIPNSQIVLKEWNGEDAVMAALSVKAPDNGLRPRVAAE